MRWRCRLTDTSITKMPMGSISPADRLIQTDADRYPFTATFQLLIASLSKGNYLIPAERPLLPTQYLQQLAIITPYAQLELEYHCHANPKKDLTAVYRRRSDQMPPLAYEVKHHPGSVNNLLVQQLIHRREIHKSLPSLTNDTTPHCLIAIYSTF